MKRKNKIKGFTLVEIIIAMVIMSIVSILFIDSLVHVGQSFSLFDKRKESVYMVNFGLKRMLKDLRYIKRGGVTQASSTQINFKDAFGRVLSFKLNGSIIELSTDGGANYANLAEKIGNLNIKYFDKFNNLLTTPIVLGNIHWLEITIQGTETLLSYSNTIQVFPREMFR